ncbi:MAG: hypothetical protein HYU52_09540 [Acidobacteria bacterium]|nr:hypothetical protein [Acidobacteriota bacterium]
MRSRASRARFIFLAAALLCATGPVLAKARVRTPVAKTRQFAFYSNFSTNLNDALIAAGDARRRHKPELFHDGAEEPCFAKLPPPARAAWDRSVDYYAEILSPSERQQYLVRVHLAGFDDELGTPRDRQVAEIAAAFREAARPAYEACRWAAQDEDNRRWIATVHAQLLLHEKVIARRLEALYQNRWGSLPIPVEVVQTVNWSGANTILRDPDGGQILVAVENPERSALEIVFHEASHILTGRGAPIRKALEDAAAAHNLTLPGDLWHVVLFYTTGEVVRSVLSDAGDERYSPMLYEILERGGEWNNYRNAIESTWPAYMNGKRTLADAAGDLVKALPWKQ